MLILAKDIFVVNIFDLFVHDSDFVYIRIYLRYLYINIIRGVITSYLRYILNNIYIKYLLYNEYLFIYG